MTAGLDDVLIMAQEGKANDQSVRDLRDQMLQHGRIAFFRKLTSSLQGQHFKGKKAISKSKQHNEDTPFWPAFKTASHVSDEHHRDKAGQTKQEDC